MKRFWLYLRLSYHNTASLGGVVMMIFGMFLLLLFSPNLASKLMSGSIVIVGFMTWAATNFGRESLMAYESLMTHMVLKQSDFRFRLIGYKPHCVIVGYRLALEDAIKLKLIDESKVKGLI
jgi:hypothetical protein